MTDIICPNCHSVTPPFKYCLNCNAELEGVVKDLAARTAAIGSTGRSEQVAIKRGGEASVQMDAYLRRACRRTSNHGICKVATSAAEEDEFSVIAKVTDPYEFAHALGGRVRVLAQIGGISYDETKIVTARIRADEHEIEMLHEEDYVKSLKAARRIRPHLESLRSDIFTGGGSSLPDHMAGGAGVIVGIIDFGFDFVHRNFRDEDGHTRILALWDQKGARRADSPYGYGRLFSQSDINDVLRDGALDATGRYNTLKYHLPKDGLAGIGAHGTYVADVAAGNGLGSSASGVAPVADIVFVDLATTGIPINSSHSVGNTFGDSAQLLEAIKYIFDFAKEQNKPCVINISLGTNSGPHDGKSLVEEAIDRLVRQEPNRAVVIAAGNSFGKALHATGPVPADGFVDLRWRIPRFESTSNELEIWYPGCDRLAIDVIDPGGTVVAHLEPGEHWEKGCDSKARELMTVVNRLHDPNNEDNTITVFVERAIRDGVWTLRLQNRDRKPVDFHAWIERNDRGQSRFAEPHDGAYTISNEYTLNSIACGHESIVVGSYNTHEDDLPLSEFSSSGPTRDQREEARQPTLCAPGDSVLAAQSGTEVLRHRESGTSMSAAAVTGTIALMLAEAHAWGIELSSAEIRKILTETVRPGDSDWSRAAGGAGRLDASKAVDKVRHKLANPHEHGLATNVARAFKALAHSCEEASDRNEPR